MNPLVQHRGRVVPMLRPNIDTDQIIPKQFLKRIERTGYGAYLFYDWRFDETGSPRPDFILNQPRYQGASVIVAGTNFGCGSSREHAPWALLDYGIRVVIAASFADIFYQNAVKNGLLPVTVAPDVVAELARRADEGSYFLTVDVAHLTLRDDQGWSLAFALDPYIQETLLKGLDDIARTLKRASLIQAYEEAHGLETAPRMQE